jgi:hypothetical protein
MSLSFKILTVVALSGLMIHTYWIAAPTPPLDSLNWHSELLAHGDAGRFLCQGKWLSEGRGFREVTSNGDFCTYLPPGYPLFLSILMSFGFDIQGIRIAQGILHITSSLLFLFATHRRFPRLGFLFSLLLGMSPQAAASATVILSEVLSIFLLCCIIFLISLLPSTRSSLILASVGGLAMLAALTAPVLLPISAGLILVGCLIAHRISGPRLTLLPLFSAALSLLIWQIHCVVAVGSPVWTLMKVKPNGALTWIRAWACSESEMLSSYHNICWSTKPNFFAVPNRAFPDSVARDEIEALSLRIAAYENDFGSPNPALARQLMALMTNLGEWRKKEHWIQYYFAFPFARGISSFLSFHPADFQRLDSPEYILRLNPVLIVDDIIHIGFGRGCRRAARGLLSLFSVCHKIFATVFGLAILFHRRRKLTVIQIVFVACFAGFLYIHGFYGPEPRRNLPVFVLLFGIPVVERSWELDPKPRESSRS